ncbi:DUF4012 domain-containing protein [Nocardioides sp. cx-169]|uniref:DUF4012 domain-containing protein n=1 Tax=Nocardioides sp. cx-169 TaxID=2899080 RepID=UPI001E5C2587|nr:DUF4012 domain-containing protein [Nocardioides sp. cx-169]MCD4533739.1 DUF4012 domain-containing protein [Nocardioides sp. cx-169]
MVTRRRVLMMIGGIVLVAVVFTAWQAVQLQRDLTQAEASVDRLTAAVTDGDAAARDEAIEDLQEAAASAAGRTDGPWWAVLTKVPMLGDDTGGLRALSSSLDVMANDGIGPLATTLDDLDRLSADGRIDLDVVEGLRDPVDKARTAFREAAADVDGVDSGGFVGALRPRFDDYVDRVTDAASALDAADTAVDVVPAMVGAEGPRDYLLIFQNNAEIRGTGGMPGAWARIHAEDGRLEMVKQGTALDFPMAARPVLPLTQEETAVYGQELGTYFQDPGFTPDFPRAAELWQAHWDARYPSIPIDGVISLDPVAMSYLLEGTGPVAVGSLTLTPDNLVEELLNKPYLELDVSAQDALFAEAAAAIFGKLTGDLESPVDMIRGMGRAADEKRFLVASFDETVGSQLEGTAVAGAFPGDDGKTPHVDVGLNDATPSKMSYYLRYWGDARATGCTGGRQKIEASMSMSQAIAPGEAAALPDSVTGGGIYGTEPGTQLVLVRLYGPYGGTIDQVRIDGARVPPEKQLINGRPVTTLAMGIETRDDVVITWSMTSGPGQTGDGAVGMTPGVQRGSKGSTFANAC